MTLPFSIEAPYVMIPDSLAIHDEVMFTLCSIYSNCTQDKGCLVTTYVKAPITSLEWQTLNSCTVMRIEAGEDPPLLTHPWSLGLHSQEFGWTRDTGGRGVHYLGWKTLYQLLTFNVRTTTLHVQVQSCGYHQLHNIVCENCNENKNSHQRP